VLRLRAGEELTVSDGLGGWRRCRFGAALDPVGDVEHDPRPSPDVTVAFAVVKGQRPEWAVQKLTEIGVDRIVPLITARSVVRWPVGAGSGHLGRLRRVAREAAMQSRRAWLPVIGDVATFADVAAEAGAALAHPDGDAPSLARPMVLVGPEGGWDDAELGAGLPRVRLGAHVLRTETAAVVAGALLCALRTK
jgi:16S rRNA (uracil1498-N3)-methyltransferase